MTSEEAKNLLSLHRPGTAEADDPQIAEALAQTRRDPELRQWFEQSCGFHEAVRQKLQQIPVPEDLPQAIMARCAPLLGNGALAEDKIIRPRWWAGPGWLAAAAGIALLLGLAVFWLWPQRADRFADFRARMVRTAARQYRMDILTNNVTAVQQYLARRGAPADFAVTNGLEKLSVTGGVFSRWRNHPVSMVCFDRGDKQMLFLFVVHRSAFKDPPAENETAKVNKLLTSSWSEGDKTYLLAGPEDSAVLRRLSN